MPLDVVVVMDPIGSIKIAKDTTFAMLLAAQARGWALQALDLLDERAVRESIQRFVVARLQAWDAAATAREVLGLLTADDRHQQLLDEALRRLSRYLDGEAVKQRASELLVKHARQHGVAALYGTIVRVKWVKGRRRFRQAGDHRQLGNAQLGDGLAVIDLSGGLDSIGAIAEVDLVDVQLEDLVFA